MSRQDDLSPLARQLAGVPLFQGVPAERLTRIAGLGRSTRAAAGEFFFREDDPAEHFFVLTSGRVKLTQLTPEGHRVVLRVIGPGEAFGGVGAFGESNYPISAEAADLSTALAWTSATMRHLFETESPMALNALHFVSSRLHDLQRRHRQAMTERVERRVARAVLRLVQDAGRRVESGMEISFPISRQDLAEMTGTTLYTVSRLLSAWEERRIIRSGRQHIVLTDPHALAAIADDWPER